MDVLTLERGRGGTVEGVVRQEVADHATPFNLASGWICCCSCLWTPLHHRV